MVWYKMLALICLIICLVSSGYHLFRLIRLGKPKDFSQKAGNMKHAIRYSFTGAMSPKHKESAFLHLPTYTAGILYHLGTFLSIALFIFFLFGFHLFASLNLAVALFLAISIICGFGILIKRISTKKLRGLSNIDDYISNILVTLFQAFTALLMLGINLELLYYLLASALFLYFPVGKLKHAIYFFAARYQLGFFYGWRGVWPPKNQNAV